MAYDQNFSPLVQVGAGAAITLTSTGVGATSYVAFANIRVIRIMGKVTTTVSALSTAPVIQVIRRPVYGSTSGQVVLGTLTIPDTTVADKVVYKAITPGNLSLGDQIVFNVSTAATGSGAAGAALFFIDFDFDPEVPGNQLNMVASA